MAYRKRTKAATLHHHRHTLPAVLYLAGALLVINAWLVSQ
jgi:hypothetical protein